MKYPQGLALFVCIRRQLLFVLALWFLDVAPAMAQQQDTVPPEAAESDSTAIMAAIEVFFDGLAAKDSTAMLSVVDRDMRVVLTSSMANGDPLMRSIPIEDFTTFIVGQQDTAMLETYWDPSIRVHDNLATVWISYNFYFNDTLDHCGEDTFQFFRSLDGWKIIALADTQRREGCDADAD
ncbi:MAG: hypothetical protein AAF564_00755 [Bacteroidota bacterium]